MHISIRSPLEEDLPLILDSWQKSFFGLSRGRPHGFGPLGQMHRNDYFNGQLSLIQDLLRRPESRVLVATLPDTTDHPVAWLCGAPGECQAHFLYVFATWRREGVATQLMEAMFGTDFRSKNITMTHWTRVLPCYYQKWGVKYNPYALFRTTGDQE